MHMNIYKTVLLDEPGPNVFCNYVSKEEYIGTAFIAEGMLVWHYFLTELPTD